MIDWTNIFDQHIKCYIKKDNFKKLLVAKDMSVQLVPFLYIFQRKLSTDTVAADGAKAFKKRQREKLRVLLP